MYPHFFRGYYFLSHIFGRDKTNQYEPNQNSVLQDSQSGLSKSGPVAGSRSCRMKNN